MTNRSGGRGIGILVGMGELSSSNEGISRGRSGSPSSGPTSRRNGQGREVSRVAGRRACRVASRGLSAGWDLPKR